ncbi:MAG: calcium-binding protein [Alphaproteobacteria bacterium]|nr:MAG: calcium-binding protein [Alphaproteobacteria bacterium]
MKHISGLVTGVDVDDPAFPHWSDPAYDDFGDQSNSDLRGDAANFTNEVAEDLNRVAFRTANYDMRFTPDDQRWTLFEVGQHFTGGAEIDLARMGQVRPGTFYGWQDANNDIVTTDRGDSDDLLFGFHGNDTIVSGAGRDYLYGGEGEDKLDAGDGDDFVSGGSGEDVIVGGGGSDVIYGGDARPDGTFALSGDLDTVSYKDADYRVFIRPQFETENGAVGNVVSKQRLDGSAVGQDTAKDIQVIEGSEYGDVIVLDQNTSSGDYSGVSYDLRGHSLSGVEGDAIDGQDFASSLNIDLRNSALQTAEGGGVKIAFSNAEAARGSSSADTIKGGLYLEGRGGADTLEGDSRSQIIIGGMKDGDVYSDDGAIDIIRTGGGADTLYLGANDRVVDDASAATKIYVTSGQQNQFGARSIIFPGGSTAGAGTLLIGGEKGAPPTNPCAPGPAGNDGEGNIYEGADGTRYSLEGGNLNVEYNGNTVYLESFRNGDAGIRLREERPDQDQAECNRDPLIIDLDGDRNVVRELYDSSAYFDLDNDGFRERVAWSLKNDGFLVRDLNGNGEIDNGTELFGTGNVDSNGIRNGADGFAVLRTLDSNMDGIISSVDIDFATLRVWVDANGDAITDAGELKSLEELGLVSISLSTLQSNDLDCGCDGTEVTYMSSITRADGSLTQMYDAWLSIDQYDTREIVKDVTISADISVLPFLIGSGSDVTP